MDDFMTKPLRPATLERVVARWLPESRVPVDGEADPLDRAALAELDALGSGVTASVVTTFLDGLSERTAELRDAVAAGDSERVRRLAHGLKGSAGYVGATALAAGYARLEAGEHEVLGEVEAETVRVDGALRAVLAAGA
jgi:hypothetical protein